MGSAFGLEVLGKNRPETDREIALAFAFMTCPTMISACAMPIILRPRKNKYGAICTVVDGIRFHSKHEAKTYANLKLLERAGQITSLKIQHKFAIQFGGIAVKIRSKGYPNGRAVNHYIDFTYFDENGKFVAIDAKGVDVDVAKLKRALVEAIYGFEIKLV